MDSYNFSSTDRDTRIGSPDYILDVVLQTDSDTIFSRTGSVKTVSFSGGTSSGPSHLPVTGSVPSPVVVLGCPIKGFLGLFKESPGS